MAFADFRKSPFPASLHHLVKLLDSFPENMRNRFIIKDFFAITDAVKSICTVDEITFNLAQNHNFYTRFQIDFSQSVYTLRISSPTCYEKPNNS